MNICLVYVPFCTPATPPYSITNLAGFLNVNSTCKTMLLDLNETFHTLKFNNEQKYFKNELKEDYEKFMSNYDSKRMDCYSKNNKQIRLNEKPEFFNELLELILNSNPDFVAFSIVYSSQVFYAYSLINELNKRNIKTIIGGPAVNPKLIEVASIYLSDEIELLNYIEKEKKLTNYDDNKKNETLSYYYSLDYSKYNLDNYFTQEIVLPLKTSTTCYYQQCAFCSHFSNKKYQEYSLDFLEKTIQKNNSKNYFIIDDMIHTKRLIELSTLFNKYDIIWACQLRPTIDFTYEILKVLKESGLKFIMWGVESGNNRVLNKINKGTNVGDIEIVLNNSKKAGIINCTFIMFGFPTETKEEFLDTIIFLKKNKENIDLISSSVFGLQYGTKVYNDPEKFSIKEVKIEKRTLLDPKISYVVSEGLSNEEASKLRRQYLNEFYKINKYSDSMNFFREHMFFL